jgi:hypothetical protein
LNYTVLATILIGRTISLKTVTKKMDRLEGGRSLEKYPYHEIDDLGALSKGTLLGVLDFEALR